MTRVTTLLALSLLAGACAAELDVGPSAGVELSRNATHQSEGLEVTSDGVTDLEAGLQVDLSGVTDEAAYWMPLPSAQQPTCSQAGSIACSASSTGAGVAHGSPQPLDPSPTASRGFDPKH